MGLESYLFNIEFTEPIPEDKIVGLFRAAGMTPLVNKNSGETIRDFRSYYFEIRSGQGLTEAHCLLSPSETSVEVFSLRFSILSPRYVIDQTFKFLNDLNTFKPIRIVDTEIRNHIYRKLRKEGEVGQSFEGLNEVEENKIEDLCYIPLDVQTFKQNEPAIAKRQKILENEIGKTIEGGEKTSDFIEKKGLVQPILWMDRERIVKRHNPLTKDEQLKILKMGRIIAAINMTIDGICDHTAGTPDEELLQHYADLLSKVDLVLYGRITYELMKYWKSVAENPTGEKVRDEFAMIMNTIPKIVFSHTLKNADPVAIGWESAKLANRGLEEEVLELKQSGKDVLVGSRSLIIQLIKLNLIDEFQLCVHPVVAGSGLPLFENLTDRTVFKLTKTKTFGGGLVTLYYEMIKTDKQWN